MNVATVAFAGVVVVFVALALTAYVINAADGSRNRGSRMSRQGKVAP